MPSESDPSRSIDTGASQFKVMFTENYPEVLSCSTPYVDPDTQQRANARGLLLVNPPAFRPEKNTGPVTLGIDFGSTGTDVYMRIDNEAPKALVFETHLQQITGFAAEPFERLTRKSFVPGRNWQTDNVLSVFQDFADPEKGATTRIPLRDGHVLFVDDPRDMFDGDPRNIRSNLKWGRDRERIAAADFLKQVCLESAAEIALAGCREAHLMHSRPTAYNDDDIANVEGIWSRIEEYLNKRTGIEFDVNPDVLINGRTREPETRESITATKYFRDSNNSGKKMDVSGGAITLDIGGGTTDMAIWNDSILASHGSVMFAGRDILRAPLRKRPGILQEIDPQIDVAGIPTDKEDAFNAHLDAIIARHGKSLVVGLDHKRSDEAVEGLQTILEIGLCGLGFYAGLLVRRLIEAGKFKAERRLTVFAGGNGSKIFNWCAAGRLTERSAIHRRFSAALLAAAKIDPQETRIGIQLSERPKSEVAYGLVCQDFPFEVSKEYDSPMAGEQFLIAGAVQAQTGAGRTDTATTTADAPAPGSWNTAPTADQIQKHLIKADRALPMFCEFLGALDEAIDQDEIYEIAGDINNRLGGLAADVAELSQKAKRGKKDEKLLRDEPIFILALKAYMEGRIDKWVRS
jgi:hypothetical protein